MLKYLVIVSGILTLLSCSIDPTVPQKEHSTVNSSYSTLITLSHVNAYLLIGSVKQAQKTFDTIDNPQAIPSALLTLAELRAATGNAMEAQQAFLLAITSGQLVKEPVPISLMDYFCNQKKWPALQGYGSALIARSQNNDEQNTSSLFLHSKNSGLTQIGLCFFEQQRWKEANKWLQKLDVTQQVEPNAYLALARIAVEQQLYSDAQSSIILYEQTKDTVDAQTLWTAIEVYLALKQPDVVIKIGENMRSLFPYNKYTRKYILLTKRSQIRDIVQDSTPSPTSIATSPKTSKQSKSESKVHIIKKGETLYQLTKTYEVTITQLLLWNPNLVIEDISIGKQINVTPK